VSGLWRSARERSLEFDASALEYDRYRPRYPEGVFDDIVELGRLTRGADVIEVGAGTGIATTALVGRGLRVTALDPSPQMLAVSKDKLGGGARFVVGRFEDAELNGPVALVAAFNAWHWVEPERGVARAAQLLAPDGCLALVWTEVVSWGADPFGDRLVEEFGSPWARNTDHVQGSVRSVEEDGRFGAFEVRRHRFARTLDAAAFVAVTRTYGGAHRPERDETLRRMIDDEFGGTVTKREEAVVYLAPRR
jgi:SAM-dependent methyltransferase